MASVNVSQLSEHLLKCPVCLETFQTPKILPCLHSFCQKCLKNILKEGENIIICPTCRAEIEIPGGGVEELNTNFFINNMLDFITVQSYTSRPIDCTNCEDHSVAIARCGECVEFLCEQCLAAHKRTKLTKEHEVMDLKDLQSSDVQDQMHRPLYCIHHDKEILKYYCETCDDPVCRECLIMEHREHAYGYLKDVNNQQRKEVSELVESNRGQMAPLSKAIEDIASLMGQLEKRKDGISKEISQNFEKCKKVLCEKEEELLRLVSNECRVKLKNHALQKEGLETLLASVTSSCQFSENVLKHGNEAEVMLVKKQLTHRLSDLQNTHADFEPQEDDVIEYEFFPDEFRKAVYYTGQVKTYTTAPSLCNATGIGLHKAKANLEAMFQVTTVDRNKQQCVQGGETIAVSVVPENGEPFRGVVIDNNDGTYCISYIPKVRGTHQIQVTIRGRHIKGSPFEVMVRGRINYQEGSKTTRAFGTEGEGGGEFKLPWGITIDNERECVIVTDCGNHRVQVFDIRGDFLFKFGGLGSMKSQFNNPKGVTFSQKGYIVVADSGNHRIQVFNEDGRFVRMFGTQGSNAGELSHPCGVSYWENKEVVAVTEQDNHRLQMFTLNGEPLMTIGSQGGEDGQFLYPHHVTFNSKGLCLVSDCVNDRIQVIDEDGGYQFQFGEEGTKPSQFDGPEGIAVDDEDNILVCDNHNHRIQVFDGKGGFVVELGSFGENMGYFKNPCGIAVSDAGDFFVIDSGNHRVVQMF